MDEQLFIVKKSDVDEYLKVLDAPPPTSLRPADMDVRGLFHKYDWVTEVAAATHFWSPEMASLHLPGVFFEIMITVDGKIVGRVTIECYHHNF